MIAKKLTDIRTQRILLSTQVPGGGTYAKISTIILTKPPCPNVRGTYHSTMMKISVALCSSDSSWSASMSPVSLFNAGASLVMRGIMNATTQLNCNVKVRTDMLR